MPLYEYECKACGERIEVIRAFSDPPLTVCPGCGGVLAKLLSSPAIQFKGSGFYLTDYGKSGSSGKTAEKKNSSKGEEGKASSAPGGGDATASGGSDSSKAKTDGKSAASGSPGATTPPATSQKKSADSK